MKLFGFGKNNVAMSVPEAPKKLPTSKLILTLNDRSTLWWECQPATKESSPWNDFLKWFHGRPQSGGFVMHTQHGQDFIDRASIKRYSITYYEADALRSDK